MKIRNGFVSNSSSSSFVLVFAKVLDLNKANDFILKNKLNPYNGGNVYMLQGRDLSNEDLNEGSYCGVTTKYDFEKDPDSWFLVMYNFGNEGDDYFNVEPADDPEYSYDISEADEVVQNYYLNTTEEHGFQVIYKNCGAGHNS